MKGKISDFELNGESVPIDDESASVTIGNAEEPDRSRDAFQQSVHVVEVTGSVLSAPRDTTTRTMYAASDPAHPVMAIARCTCNKCGQSDLLPEYNYCPNCGRRFVEHGAIPE